MSEYLTKEEYKRMQNGRYEAAWYNPVDAKIYIGEHTETRHGQNIAVPDYTHAVFDVSKYKEAEKRKAAGTLDASEADFMPWIAEFADLYNEYKDAGVITNAQFSTIDTTTVLNRLLNTGIRNFTIPDAVTNIPTNGLEFNIDVFTRFNISLDVPEGVAAWSKRGSVTSTAFDLTKDVGHFSHTDEAVMKSRQDLRGAHLTDVSTDFRRAKAAKIADVLETASETNSADWDAYSGSASTNNPLVGDIAPRQQAIDGSNGNPSVIVSHDVGWAAFSTNSWVSGKVSSNFAGNQPGVSAGARIVTHSSLPGTTWYIDNELLSTSVIIMDPEAVVCVNGPTRVGQYRLEAEGIDGYVAREWYQCKLIQSGKIAELTTVTA